MNLSNKTRIFLIRHGLVRPESQERFNGSTEADLDPQGEDQLVAAARYLAPSEITFLYSSPMRRCLKSAAAFGGPLGLAVRVAPDLREMCFGVFEGLSFKEVWTRYPDEARAFYGDVGNFRLPGAETMAEVQKRAWPELEAIARSHPGGIVAVVAHGAVNRLCLARALGLNIQNVLNLSQDYAGINVLDFFPDRVVVKGINLRAGQTFPLDGKRGFESGRSGT